MPEPVKRECGDCTLCCKIMGIVELKKPQYVVCQHCKMGKGCTIYADRPDSCRKFECLWLQGIFPERFKPNKVHFIGDATSDGARVQIHLDPNYDVDWENGDIGDWLNTLVRDGVDFIICRGQERTLLSTQALFFKGKEG